MPNQQTVFRIDAGTYKKPEITAQGFLRADCYATRVGVFTYQLQDGTKIRELRPPEEVFDVESLKSLSEIPVTNDHPPVMVNASNVKQYSVGWTASDSEPDGEFLKTRITIGDEVAISDVLNKRKDQLSCGYNCWIEEAPGVWNGEKYDYIQRGIRYNHLAIVDQGRAGAEVKIKLDSKDAVMVQENEGQKKTLATQPQNNLPLGQVLEKTDQGEKIMADQKLFKTKLDGVEIEVTNQEAIEAAQTKLDSAENLKKEFETLQGKFDAQEKQIAESKATIEKLQAEKLDEIQIMQIARNRLDVETVASKVLGEEVQMDSFKSTIEIKKAVLSKHLDGKDLTDKSEDYVNGMFDSLKESIAEKAKVDFEKKLGEAGTKTDSNENAVEKAKLEQTQRAMNAWKQDRK